MEPTKASPNKSKKLKLHFDNLDTAYSAAKVYTIFVLISFALFVLIEVIVVLASFGIIPFIDINTIIYFTKIETTLQYILTGILMGNGFFLLRYLMLSYKNLRINKVPGVTYEPFWLILGNFIPLAWFIIPVNLMRQHIRGIEFLEERFKIYSTEKSPLKLVGLWWLFWIIYKIGMSIAKGLINSKTEATLIYGLIIMLVSYMGFFIAGFFILTIIKKLHLKENRIFQEWQNRFVNPQETASNDIL